MSKLLFNDTFLHAKDIAYIQSDGPGQCIVMTVRHEELHVTEGISKVPEYLKDGLYYMLSRYLYINLDRIVRINSSEGVVTLSYDREYKPLGKIVCVSGDFHEDIMNLPETSLAKLRQKMRQAMPDKKCLETKAESLYFSLDDVLFASTHKDYADARKSSTIVFMNLQKYTEKNMLINKVDDVVNNQPNRSVDARFSHSYLVKMSAIDTVDTDKSLLILKDAWGEPFELSLPREALKKYAQAIQPGHSSAYGFNTMTVDDASKGFSINPDFSDMGVAFLQIEIDVNDTELTNNNEEDMLQKRKFQKEDLEFMRLGAELDEINQQLEDLMNRKIEIMVRRKELSKFIKENYEV